MTRIVDKLVLYLASNDVDTNDLVFKLADTIRGVVSKMPVSEHTEYFKRGLTELEMLNLPVHHLVCGNVLVQPQSYYVPFYAHVFL